jgi:hypothetical protein
MVWTGSVWLRIGANGGLFEHNNKPSDSIKFWEFLSDYAIGGLSRRAQLHEVSLFSISDSSVE